MGKHPFPAEEFHAIYSRVPRLTVEVVCLTDRGVVLTRRSIEPCVGQWHLPGGTVRFGEHLRDAVARVAHDELGVHVDVGRQIGYIEYPVMLGNGYQGWPVGIAFEVSVAGGELIGGDQSDHVGCFRSVPPDTLVEQGDFLRGYLAGAFVGS
ncbi:NUDIX domain-containing protein [Dactylosporangium sp. NBC_01737]|uniref:NUDIX hydrolase n=1 Tax=Dactylosporangium sp. NBC_01737 TaxID=2975959 RepID=UPI002E1456E8|nr:NUDIX domain-containing protein [Dactylosporangium sp. NBC_01737]